MNSEASPPTHRSLASILGDLEDGQFLEDATRELDELVEQTEAVGMETGAKVNGEFTIKLKITRDGRALDVRGETTAKAPKMPRQRTTFFTHDGRLTRHDPRQMQMPFRDVNTPTAEPKTV